MAILAFFVCRNVSPQVDWALSVVLAFSTNSFRAVKASVCNVVDVRRQRFPIGRPAGLLGQIPKHIFRASKRDVGFTFTLSDTYACSWIITVDQVPIARGHDLLGKITRILVVKPSLRLGHNLAYLPTKPSYEDALHDRRRTLCWCCRLGGCKLTREIMTVSAILSGFAPPRNHDIMVDTRPSIHFYRTGLVHFFVLLPFPGGRRTRRLS